MTCPWLQTKDTLWETIPTILSDHLHSHYPYGALFHTQGHKALGEMFLLTAVHIIVWRQEDNAALGDRTFWEYF